jgi:hypothetical protein
MKYIVKAFDCDGQEIEFESPVIGEEKEVTFENEKAAQAFIEGMRISLPPTFQYRIIPKEDVQK